MEISLLELLNEEHYLVGMRKIHKESIVRMENMIKEDAYRLAKAADEVERKVRLNDLQKTEEYCKKEIEYVENDLKETDQNLTDVRKRIKKYFETYILTE